jgi:hypothetical protein
MNGVAGSERDVDEVRKEGEKTVLEKVFQRKVAMPKKKKKHHVSCPLETFSAALSVLSCCFPYLFGRRQKQSFTLPFFHLIINEIVFGQISIHPTLPEFNFRFKLMHFEI